MKVKMYFVLYTIGQHNCLTDFSIASIDMQKKQPTNVAMELLFAKNIETEVAVPKMSPCFTLTHVE